MTIRLPSANAAVVLLVCVLACGRDSPVDEQWKLDLVFVVDNTGAMGDDQRSLAASFPRFLHELEQNGRLDLHVGVISTDLGAGDLRTELCRERGHGGLFQVPPGCPLLPGTPPFLSIDRAGAANVEGSVADALGCLVKLGVTGCGFEHHLGSLRAALSDANPEFRRFLRAEAHLGIVILSNEDDCSAEPDATLFSEARPGEAPSLRCATAGHLCAGQPLTATPLDGPLSSCAPRARAADEVGRRAGLIDVETFVQHVKSLKAPHRRVSVAGIFGWSADSDARYRIVAENLGGSLTVAPGPVCAHPSSGDALPAIRLRAFVDAFGADGIWRSICAPDLGEAMRDIGRGFAPVGSDRRAAD